MAMAFGILASCSLVVRLIRKYTRHHIISKESGTCQNKYQLNRHMAADFAPATTSAKPDELVVTLRKQLAALKHARKQERKGRINAERALRQVSQERFAREGYTFKPIGIVHSCFPDRRGTPRQPTLCPVVQTERTHYAIVVLQNSRHSAPVHLFYQLKI